MNDVAAILRDARGAAGLTQVALARCARTSQPAVAAYESGTRTPTLPTLERLLAACGRTLVLDSRLDAMTSGLLEIRLRRIALLDAAMRNGVTNVRIFGSVARAETVAGSDVDLLVDLEPGRTLVDLAAFREDAVEVLGTAVDVATPDLLKPSVRDEALREAIAL